ncbi:MAG TPA: restriction endonuclease subunit S [Lachnospiraceae bacterium]|nr:restriction endonuclease subunit S [Lachnospiraceae bacterium]
MSKWREVKLGEVVEIIGGGTPKTTVEEYWNGDIPWLSVKDFNTNFRRVYETEKMITELGLANSSAKILNKGDIVISARGTVGALAQLGRSMAFNQSCYGLKQIENISNIDFIYYALKSKIEEIKRNTHGSVFNTITMKTFDILSIPLPSIPEQKTIADILSVFDDKIEVNNQINKKLEEIVQAIFKTWFVDFEPYKDGEFEDSELGRIPKGWKVGEVEKLATFKNGKGIKSEYRDETGKYKIMGSNGVIGYTNEVLFNDPVIMIGRVGANYGEIHYLIDPCWVSDNAIASQPLDGNDFWFILNILLQIDYSNFVAGSAQPLITQTAVKSYKTILPSRDVLDEFNNIVKDIYLKINMNIKENDSLQLLRDILLPKLMRLK